MPTLKENEIEIIDGEKTLVMKILFTCNKDDRNVVFFMENDDSDEVMCAYYNEDGTLEELSQDDFDWANDVFEQWNETTKGE